MKAVLEFARANWRLIAAAMLLFWAWLLRASDHAPEYPYDDEM